MPAPKADPPKCDVPGCGMLATTMTDGAEKDPHGLGRVAVKNLNLCASHGGWAFSDDAARFAANPESPYRGRK